MPPAAKTLFIKRVLDSQKFFIIGFHHPNERKVLGGPGTLSQKGSWPPEAQILKGQARGPAALNCK
jgi:hypothetical protein